MIQKTEQFLYHSSSAAVMLFELRLSISMRKFSYSFGEISQFLLLAEI